MPTSPVDRLIAHTFEVWKSPHQNLSSQVFFTLLLIKLGSMRGLPALLHRQCSPNHSSSLPSAFTLVPVMSFS